MVMAGNKPGWYQMQGLGLGQRRGLECLHSCTRTMRQCRVVAGWRRNINASVQGLREPQVLPTAEANVSTESCEVLSDDMDLLQEVAGDDEVALNEEMRNVRQCARRVGGRASPDCSAVPAAAPRKRTSS